MPKHTPAHQRLTMLHAAAALSAAVVLGTAASAGATVTAELQDQTLLVNGDGADDRISITLAADEADEILVDGDDDGVADATFPRTAVLSLQIRGGGGDDRVGFVEPARIRAPVNLIVLGEDGDDALDGSSLSETLAGGAGDDLVSGRRGEDTMVGGEGADHFTWAPGEGSDVVAGGGGEDVLEFLGADDAERFRVRQEGTEVAIHRDLGSVSMLLSALERVDLDLLGGSDELLVDAGLTAAPMFDVDGGPGTDTIVGAEGPDRFAGGDDDDTLVGGAGRDRLDGGSGADVLRCGGDGDEVIFGPGDLLDADCLPSLTAPAPVIVAPPAPGVPAPEQPEAQPHVDGAGESRQPEVIVVPASPSPTLVGIRARGRRATIVRLANPGASAVQVHVTVTERGPFGRRHTARRAVLVAPGARARVRIAVPAALRRHLARAARAGRPATRRPVATASAG